MGERAAKIAARVEKRLRELESRPKATGLSPEFVRAANRMANLRPVRIGLTSALKRGKKAHVTVLNGVPIAFFESGWMTQEMVDARIAKQRDTRARRGGD
jgi:hypothetical protein